jgi:KUP system potassium uptake protein
VQTGHNSHFSKVTAAGLLVTLGIIYGDIGTSPLYVLKAIVGEGNIIDRDVVFGGISCIFWTLTLQTTIKYVLLTLRADNKGEGGIFALYALVKKTKVKWLMYPAMIGGCCILGEGIITPPISVASAIEGLENVKAFEGMDIPTVPIVLIIITLLFTIQQFGTSFVGRSFGPMMLIWFLMLGVLGISQMAGNWGVLAAVSPHYAIKLLIDHPGGFWLLGAVFLCTTGAEALYSDLGHCGRKNIQTSWIFVKTMLLLNYFGQGALLINRHGEVLDYNPFYAVMPSWFLPVGITIATIAAIVASQALISGSFTLINEAIRLNFWPKVRIKYPTDLKGQIYIPSVNWLLWAGCMAIVLIFEKSSAMEAAYGLTIIVGMFMSSRLLAVFLRIKKYSMLIIASFTVVYLIVELAFLVANMKKFSEGGWVSLLIASGLFIVMWCWQAGRRIRNRYVEFVKLDEYLPLIVDLSKDLSIPKYATHIVYLTSANQTDEIEQKVIYSILQKQPKRADIYWLVHVDVVDEPYRMDYKVTEIVKNDVIRVDFRLGFRVAPRINLMFRKVIEDMVKNHEVDITSRYESLNKNNVIGDFRFVVIEKFISYNNEFPFFEKIILDIYGALKWLGLSEAKAFGLDTSSVQTEKFPLVLSPVKIMNLKRVTSLNQLGTTPETIKKSQD